MCMESVGGVGVKGGAFVRCADSINLTFNNLTLVGCVDGGESMRQGFMGKGCHC